MRNAKNRKRFSLLLFVAMFGAAAVVGVAGSQSSSPGSEQAGAGADKMDSAAQSAVDIVRDPSDVAPPVGNRAPQLVKVTLVAQELEGKLDPSAGSTYKYWTFNGKVPGPFIRVRVGDTIEIHLKNSADSSMMHSVDFHAATGPGGGAAVLQSVQVKINR